MKNLSVAYAMKRRAAKKMSEGGMAMPESISEKARSIAEAIRQKRMDKGVVDLEENSEEHPNGYDPLNELAANDPQYDDDQLSEQPWDSNQDGMEMDEDPKYSLAKKIRRKMMSKR